MSAGLQLAAFAGIAVSPWARRVLVAWAWDWPITDGTIGVVALQTPMPTLVPAATDVPADGSWLTTRPLSFALQLLVLAAVTASPWACRVLVAWAWDWPITDGTTTAVGVGDVGVGDVGVGDVGVGDVGVEVGVGVGP